MRIVRPVRIMQNVKQKFCEWSKKYDALWCIKKYRVFFFCRLSQQRSNWQFDITTCFKHPLYMSKLTGDIASKEKKKYTHKHDCEGPRF